MADETEEEVLSVNFIVEDGSCVSGANSYLTLEEANQYQRNKNRSDWLALTDDEKLASLIKGTQYVNALYKWKGRRKYKQQELSFPRVMIIDYDGFPVEGIPKQIKAAVCEAAFYGYKADAELFINHNENGKIKKQRVEGAVEVEYFNSSDGEVTDYISKYGALDSILMGLYRTKDTDDTINARVCWSW